MAFEEAHDIARELIRCESADPAPEITEVAIERTACYGACPAYSMILRGDGSVEYHGAADVERVGVRRGTISTAYFRYLAELATEIDSFELKSHYACEVTDNPTVYTSVTRGPERKIIRHYAPRHAGPARLRAFEEAVDAAQAAVQWHE